MVAAVLKASGNMKKKKKKERNYMILFYLNKLDLGWHRKKNKNTNKKCKFLLLQAIKGITNSSIGK